MAYIIFCYYPYTLKSFCEEETITEYDVAFDFVSNLVEGISFLHRKRIVHADLNPQNIFVGIRDGKQCLLIGDMDRSREINTGHTEFTSAAHQTWVAPEQIRNRYLKSYAYYAVDYFCVGLLLNYIFTSGRHLFENPDDHNGQFEIQKHIYYSQKYFETPFIGEEKGEWVRCFVVDLIDRLTHQDPDKRLSLYDALNHPLFWTEDKLKKEVERMLELQSEFNFFKEALQDRTIYQNFSKKFTRSLFGYMRNMKRKFSKTEYDVSSTYSCLVYIRNFLAHHKVPYFNILT